MTRAVAHPFWHAHYSGFYDQSARDLVAGMAELMDRGAEVVILTEIQDPKRFTALRAYLHGKGWFLFHEPKRDVGIAFSWDRWLADASEYVKITEKTYRRVGGAVVESWCPFVVLTDRKSGRKWLFTGRHAPSHVATTSGWRDYYRVIVHRAGSRGHAAKIQKWRRIFKIGSSGGVVCSMDINLDAQQPWVRRHLKRIYFPLQLLADPSMSPTHGKRVIDVVLAGRTVERTNDSIELVKIAGDDHKAVMVRLGRRINI